jgi:hypothetical protein
MSRLPSGIPNPTDDLGEAHYWPFHPSNHPATRRQRMVYVVIVGRGYRTVALRAFGASRRVADPLPSGQ